MNKLDLFPNLRKLFFSGRRKEKKPQKKKKKHELSNIIFALKIQRWLAQKHSYNECWRQAFLIKLPVVRQGENIAVLTEMTVVIPV